MAFIKFKPFNKQTGQVQQNYGIFGQIFRREAGWFEIKSQRHADLMRELTVNAYDPSSAKVFDVFDSREDAEAFERKQLEMEMKRQQIIPHAGIVDALNVDMKNSNDPYDSNKPVKSEFMTPLDPGVVVPAGNSLADFAKAGEGVAPAPMIRHEPEQPEPAPVVTDSQFDEMQEKLAKLEAYKRKAERKEKADVAAQEIIESEYNEPLIEEEINPEMVPEEDDDFEVKPVIAKTLNDFPKAVELPDMDTDITLKEIAKLCGVQLTTAKNWQKTGVFNVLEKKIHKERGQIYYNKDAVLEVGKVKAAIKRSQAKAKKKASKKRGKK